MIFQPGSGGGLKIIAEGTLDVTTSQQTFSFNKEVKILIASLINLSGVGGDSYSAVALPGATAVAKGPGINYANIYLSSNGTKFTYSASTSCTIKYLALG